MIVRNIMNDKEIEKEKLKRFTEHKHKRNIIEAISNIVKPRILDRIIFSIESGYKKISVPMCIDSELAIFCANNTQYIEDIYPENSLNDFCYKNYVEMELILLCNNWDANVTDRILSMKQKYENNLEYKLYYYKFF